jgi:OPA family sugar phosphate sensor protein UhpC-like MFS transporter
MAIDVVPRKATGAALGIVGCASYIAAGIQDVVSGYLIDSGKTEILNELGEKVTQYDFSQAALFWIGASVVSFLLPVLNWGKKVKEE